MDGKNAEETLIPLFIREIQQYNQLQNSSDEPKQRDTTEKKHCGDQKKQAPY